jgi:hypothetical protein
MQATKTKGKLNMKSNLRTTRGVLLPRFVALLLLLVAIPAFGAIAYSLMPVGDEPSASGEATCTAKRILVHGAAAGYGWEGKVKVNCSGLTPGESYIFVASGARVQIKPVDISDDGVADEAGELDLECSYRAQTKPNFVKVYRIDPQGRVLVLSGPLQ